MAIRPVLITNPVDDRVFAAAAERVLDEGLVDLDAFCEQLRGSYPDVAAHPREITAEPILIWYVYRDGRWVNSAPRPSSSGASSADDRPARRPEGNRAGDSS